MHRSILIVAVAALALSAPAVANAAPDEVTVDLSGIDTSSDSGAGHALRRIQNAAEQVCDVRRGPQSYSERAAARACARDAVERAVDALDAPQVTALYSRSGRAIG